MADLEIPLLDPDAQVKCADCDWTGKWVEARLRIVDFASTIALADKIPAGQCPQCSELVFLVQQHMVGDHGLAYTARALFPLFCDLHSGISKLISQGVISEETMGEHWNWLNSAIEKLEMKENEVLVSELERILDNE